MKKSAIVPLVLAILAALAFASPAKAIPWTQVGDAGALHTIASVPAPLTLSLMGIGALMLGLVLARHRPRAHQRFMSPTLDTVANRTVSTSMRLGRGHEVLSRGRFILDGHGLQRI